MLSWKSLAQRACLLVIGMSGSVLAIDFEVAFNYKSAPRNPLLTQEFEASVSRMADSWSTALGGDFTVNLNVSVESLQRGNLGSSYASSVTTNYTNYVQTLGLNVPSGLIGAGTSALPANLSELSVAGNVNLTSNLIEISETQLRAIDPTAADPTIDIILNANMISGGAGTYDLNRYDGIGADQWDLESVVGREITRGLGLRSGSFSNGTFTPTLLDLFSFEDGTDFGPNAVRSMTAGPNRVYNDGRGAIVPFDDSNLGTWAYQENEHGMASDLLPGDFFNFSTFDLSFFDLSLIPIDLLPVDTNLNGELDFEGDDGDLAKFVEYLDNIGNVDNNNPADPLIHWVANASFHFADLIRGPFDPGNPNIQFSEMKDNEVDILDIDPFLVMHCVVEHPTCSGSSMPVPEPNAQVSSIIGLLCLLCLRRHVGKRQS